MLRSEPTQPVFPGRRKTVERFHRNRLLLFTREQSRELRQTVAEPGTIRRFEQVHAGYIGAAPAFSFTANGFDHDSTLKAGEPLTNTRRFLISTRNVLTAGNQLSQPMRRPAVPPRVLHTPPALVMAGNVGYRPTIRSRVPSFGSRVPALNGPGVAGTEQ